MSNDKQNVIQITAGDEPVLNIIDPGPDCGFITLQEVNGSDQKIELPKSMLGLVADTFKKIKASDDQANIDRWADVK